MRGASIPALGLAPLDFCITHRTVAISTVQQDALRQVTDALGLRSCRRLAGGENGAYEAWTTAGVHVVVKVMPWWQDLASVRQAVDFAENLRSDGYPAPRYLAVESVDESVATVQEFIQGCVPSQLSTGLLTRMLELWRQHQDVTATLSGATPAAVRAELATDFDNGIKQADELLAKLDDPPVSHVLRRSREILTNHQLDVFRTGDVVHNDFHHANLLVRDEEIVAILDWEQATAGDARADILRLYAAAIAARQIDPDAVPILEAEVDRIPPEIRLPLAARKAIGDLGFALEANPKARDWALASSCLLLGDAVSPTW